MLQGKIVCLHNLHLDSPEDKANDLRNHPQKSVTKFLISIVRVLMTFWIFPPLLIFAC